jgi:hypothetical protein
LKIVDNLIEHGCVGMLRDEKEDFVLKAVEKVKT